MFAASSVITSYTLVLRSVTYSLYPFPSSPGFPAPLYLATHTPFCYSRHMSSEHCTTPILVRKSRKETSHVFLNYKIQVSLWREHFVYIFPFVLLKRSGIDGLQSRHVQAFYGAAFLLDLFFFFFSCLFSTAALECPSRVTSCFPP